MSFDVTRGASENAANPIGVYRHPQLKVEIGCIDPAQADAVVQQGFQLVKQFNTAAEVTEATQAKTAPVATPATPVAPSKEND